MKKAVVCTVPGNDVQAVVGALRGSGISNTEISILAPHAEGMKNADLIPDALHGAETGAVVGGAVGELASVASLMISGLGPFVVIGPLATLLVGALGGTLVGGLTAATGEVARLVGIPGRVAQRFEEQLRGGRALILVHYRSSEHKSRAVEVFEQFGAADIQTTQEIEAQGRATRT